MISEEEAKRLFREGQVQSAEPFVEGTIEVPQALLDRLEELEYRTAKILVANDDGVLEAVEDEGRKSSVCRMDNEVQTEYFDLWKKAADTYAPKWLEKNPEYFDTWVQGENGQIIQYNEGDYFLIHNDGGDFSYDFKIDNEKVCRVLMVAVALSNPEDYDGGELVFPSEPRSFKFKVGDVLCFPAPMRHLVTEITRGKRYLLIGQYYAPITQAHRNLMNDQFDREVP